MHNVKIAVEGGDRNALGAFNAAAFFTILRACGVNPRLRFGGLYCNSMPRSTVVIEARAWAAHHDPDGRIRMEYALQIWNTRKSEFEIIELGL